MSETITRTIQLRSDVAITLTESGSGRAALILHGGGGPATVQSIAGHLAPTMHVITPTHPGWNGTERPAWLATIADLARVYVQLLHEEGLHDVVVIGSSIGGWIACDMALRDDQHLISGLVLIDAGGVEIPGQPTRDVFALSPREITEYSFHDPNRFYVDPTTLPPEQVARQRANMATMRALGGDHLYDPQLLQRLGQIHLPTLVLWGDSDRMFTPAYGQAYASALGNARFTVIPNAGHLPHIEQPAATFAALDGYLGQR